MRLLLATAATLSLAATSLLATVTRTPFGHLPDGTTVDAFTLANVHGVEVRVMTYGATLISVRAPDRNGTVDDIVLGFQWGTGADRFRKSLGERLGKFGLELHPDKTRRI